VSAPIATILDHDRRVLSFRRRRRPLRVQLTAAFASVIALVLTASGVLIYTQFRR